MLGTVGTDLLVVVICLALGLLIRYGFLGYSSDEVGIPLLRRNKHLVLRGGLAVFFGAFIWCLGTLALGLSSVGIVLAPTLVGAGLGWVALSVSSAWMQQNPWWIVALGVAGIALAFLWLLFSAETLSRSNGHNFYWIFYPAIAIITYSVFALTWPAARWFLGSAGLLDDK